MARTDLRLILLVVLQRCGAAVTRRFLARGIAAGCAPAAFFRCAPAAAAYPVDTAESAALSAVATRDAVRVVVRGTPQMAGKLVRLAFHDGVRRDGKKGGPNGSIRFELEEAANMGLGEVLATVERVRGEVGGLSLADTIASRTHFERASL